MATIRYSNQNAIRNDPLSSELYQILLAAAEAAGISTVVVGSGGQEAAGEGGTRTGSTRHDHGNAGDIKLLVGDRTLDFSNPNDVPIFQRFVAAARQGGATGFGAGPNYMGTQTIHVGFGTPAVWGGTGENADPAPSWLRTAFENPTASYSGPMAYAGTPQQTGAQAAAAGLAGSTGQDATSPAAPQMQFPILDRIKARMGDRPTPLLDRLRERLTDFRQRRMDRWGGQPQQPAPPVMASQPSTASQLTPGGPWEAVTMPGIGTPAAPQPPPASPAAPANRIQSGVGTGKPASTGGTGGYNFDPSRPAHEQAAIYGNQVMPGFNTMPREDALKAQAFSHLMGAGPPPVAQPAPSMPPKPPLVGMNEQMKQRLFANLLGFG